MASTTPPANATVLSLVRVVTSVSQKLAWAVLMHIAWVFRSVRDLRVARTSVTSVTSVASVLHHEQKASAEEREGLGKRGARLRKKQALPSRRAKILPTIVL